MLRSYLAIGLVVVLHVVSQPGTLRADSAQADAATPLPEQGVPTVATERDSSADTLDVDRLAAFIDGVVRSAMETDHLPGVTVSVVLGDRTVFARGYGLARLDPPQPVIAEQTLFRVGSISKVFTFTGVMQLVEQGRLDLDTDIETLTGGVSLSEDFGPVTMTNLMTHSAGYEDSYIGHFYARGPETDHAPKQYLETYEPHRVRPPGDQIVYSNYGVMLAGQVLANLSGEEFSQYMQDHIFEPLDMHRSSFLDYPGEAREGYLSQELADSRAIGYAWSGGRYEPVDKSFMHRASYPAGSVSSTATDMARFMRAHLNRGELNGRRILEPETAERMHKRLLGNAEGIAGNAHGFWRNQIRGYQTVEHGGAVLGFLSDMVLIPELGLGVFVSTNGAGGRAFVVRLPRLVVEEFYPPRRKPAVPEADFAPRSEVYTGRYLPNRRGFRTVDKLVALGSELQVTADEDGVLIVSRGGQASRWIHVDGNRFENAITGDIMAFELDASGRASRVFAAYGHTSADRVALVHSSQFFYATAASVVVLSVGTLIGVWLRRGRRVAQTGREAAASISLYLASVVWLVAVVTFAVVFSEATGEEPDLLIVYPGPVELLVHWSVVVAAGLSVIAALGLIPVWKQKSWGLWRRLRYTVVSVSYLVMVLVMHDWNLLGFRYLG